MSLSVFPSICLLFWGIAVCSSGRCSKNTEADFWPHLGRPNWVFYGVGTAAQCAATVAVLRLSAVAGALVLHLGFNSESGGKTEQAERKR